MKSLPRREVLRLGLAAAAMGHVPVRADNGRPADVHQELLALAARQEQERRARFAAVKTPAELGALQESLRQAFIGIIGGLPARPDRPPTVTTTGRIEAEDYLIEKLVFESWPGYFVSALLYKPKQVTAKRPGILSPCGHSPVGKAAEPYQILHMNLAKRGYVVLTYDPVGQGERSQFWDSENGRSRYDLVCGEHAVLGNALYLLGSSLARFRIWDGLRGLDYLASLPEVDPTKLGCVGNSGGGALTAYLSALDTRIAAAVIGCYTTALPRRMNNRIQADPDADPEQDIFGFVSEGIDHAGLLALCAPRPTLLATAQLDFFPIAGARETFVEAQGLYKVAGDGERIARAEAPGRHGLSRPLREAVYGWFDRWLAGREAPAAAEFNVQPRPADSLRVCAEGQVNVTFRSRFLLSLALEEFRKQPKPTAKKPLRDLLGLDLGLDVGEGKPRVTQIARGYGVGPTVVVCINGNESPDWREEREFLAALERTGHAVVVVDPRGVGILRPGIAVPGHDYADPLAGVEENIAYNAFLVGRSLLGLRVSDALAAVRQVATKTRASRIVLCARRDAALVACFAAAIEPSIHGVATEEMRRSMLPLFAPSGEAINAASILPGLLRDFGDIPDVLAKIAPRRVLIAAGIGEKPPAEPSVQVSVGRFTKEPRVLTDWIRG